MKYEIFYAYSGRLKSRYENKEMHRMTYKIGDKVILTTLPPGLLAGLPDEDQDAIILQVGAALTVTGFEADEVIVGFTDQAGDSHSIWVNPTFIKPV
jgi:hypothetical protein